MAKKIKWTFELAKEKALQYKTIGAFKDRAKGAYKWALENNVLDEICCHMTTSCKRNGFWTYDKCKAEALKYKTRSLFRKGCCGAYNAAWTAGFLDEICEHMPKQRQKDYWNKAKCAERALLYKYRKDFKKYDEIAYQKAFSKGWPDEICSHMEELIKPADYWNKKRCAACASKCETRGEFKRLYNSAYIASRVNKWLDEICSHMRPAASYLKRFIYVYGFEDGSAYIGLTCDFERRTKNRERTNDRVWQKSQKMEYSLMISDVAYDIYDAIRREKGLIALYKKLGITLLNKTKGGELGGGYVKKKT